MKGLRKLVQDSLTNSQFETLCFDNFRPVYDGFTTGQDRDARILSLITYVEKQILINKLLECIQEINPNAYAEYLSPIEADELIDILQASENNFSQILEAYLATISNWPVRVNRNVENVQSIVTELNKIAQGKSTYRALDEFISYVFKATQNSILSNRLQQWGIRYRNGIDWLYFHEKIQDKRLENAQPAIFITIARSDEVTTQDQDGLVYYQVNAWLIRDINNYRINHQGISSINIAGGSDNKIILHSDLKQDLSRIICSYLKESSQFIKQDPALHIFVPLDLMNEAIDCWKLDDGFGRPELMGRQYIVVLRSAERVSRSYRQKPRWEKKWIQCQSLLEDAACNAFIEGDDSDLDNLYYDLDEANDSVIGLSVTQAPKNVGNDSLFGILLQSGIPLAVWGRCQLKSLKNKDELNRVLNVSSLKNLPETVKTERRAARRVAEDDHIGHHLSLLWDDPSLVPPRSA
jgi:vWA-MoxR associated protein C-terminal domain/Effector-associated domain 7/vWA-MoxR associated protein middle region (VMAP-M) 1